MVVKSWAFRLARLYGKYAPLSIGKERLCFKILSLARIIPWKNPANWKRIVQNLPSEQISFEGVIFECNWSQNLGLLLTHEYEPYVRRVVKRVIRPGDVVLDVGANMGFYSLLFARYTGPKGRVYAYEPVGAAVKRLRRHLELNKDIEKADIIVREKGLSNSTGSAKIYIPKIVWGDYIEISQASIIKDMRKTSGREMVELEINLTRLDDETIQDTINLVKCDVEGAEKLFLEGAFSTLSRDKPMMVLEWSPGPKTYSGQEIAHLIQSIGDYSLFSIRYNGLRRKRLDEDIDRYGYVLCAIRELHEERLAGLVKDW